MEYRVTRQTVSVEERADKKPVIHGYGAVFYDPADPGTEYELWEDAVERILPGAFDKALVGDVRSCFNHDPNIVLGRTRASTLTLSVDRTGFKYSSLAPDTQLVKEQVISPINRGDVTGSSIMFNVTDQTWREETVAGKTRRIRELRGVEVLEVGPVTFPAYLATTSGTRAGGDIVEARKAYDDWLNGRGNGNAVAVRARFVEVQERELLTK